MAHYNMQEGRECSRPIFAQHSYRRAKH